MSKFNRKYVPLVISLLFAPLLLAAVLTVISFSHIQSAQFAKAAKSAKLASYPLKAYSLITFRAVPGLEAWKSGSELLSNYVYYREELQATVGQDYLIDLQQLFTVNNAFNQQFQPLVQNFNRAPLLKLLVKRKFSPEQLSAIQQTADTSIKIEQILKNLLDTDQTWVVVLQNSDELRATGGFAGSYVVVSINDGKITDLVTEDIYDADGQFKGFVPPPPGVKEYLSSSNGLRLPDANWHADFPSSAAQMLQFFAFGNRQNIAGLVTINSPLAENLIDLVGPVYLTDYDAVFTADNVTELLRTEREEFFPGSIQKKHLISLLLNQLKLEITSLSTPQYLALLQIIENAAQSKELLIYARNPELQKQFESLGLAGRLADYQSSDYLYLLESNVGINKANNGIMREVYLDITDETISTTTTFHNNNNSPRGQTATESALSSTNQAPHNGYVNYQRVLVKPSWELQQITYGGDIIEDYHVSTLTTDDLTLTEIGFLITLKEKETKRLQITFKRLSSEANPLGSLAIQKQPGIPSTLYTINTPKTTQTFALHKDLVLTLPDLQEQR